MCEEVGVMMLRHPCIEVSNMIIEMMCEVEDNEKLAQVLPSAML